MLHKVLKLLIVFFWFPCSVVFAEEEHSRIDIESQYELIFDVTTHPAVEVLRCLLVGEGVLAKRHIKGHSFDWYVYLATVELQKRAGLRPVGNVRQATLRKLVSNNKNWTFCTGSEAISSTNTQSVLEKRSSAPETEQKPPNLINVPSDFLLDPKYHKRRKHDAFLRPDFDKDFRKILSKYKNIANNSVFPKIDSIYEGVFLRRGLKGEVVEILCKRLALEGFISSDECSATYDINVQYAFYDFKRGHQLVVNDLLGKRVIRVLNVSAQAKYEVLQRSYKQFSDGFQVEKLSQLLKGKPYLVANVPAGRVHLVFNDKVWEYRAIMGAVAHETPQFSDDIYSITLHPTWTPTIRYRIRKLHKKFLKQPSLIEKLGFYVFNEKTGERLSSQKYNYKGTWIKRIPGADNPLGLVRINTLNDRSIYLHSTSQLKLFDKVDRYFSEGCIRVEGIGDLAARILDLTTTIPGSKELDLIKKLERYDGGWKEGETIVLKNRIPLFVIPFTAWPNKGGESAQFRDDPYNS